MSTAIIFTLTLALTAAGTDATQPQPTTEARAAHFYRADEGPPPPARPRRIVSLAPVATEALFLVGAGERVVGVTRFCDRPSAASSLPKIGGYTDASIERILLLKPDLVIAMPSFSQRATLDRVRDAGIPVFVVFTDTLDEVRALPRSIGAVVGEAGLGDEVARRFDAELDALSTHAPRRIAGLRVLLIVGTDPIVVAGPSTFADELLTRLGAVPVARRGGPAWPQWSPEAVLTSKPDIVVATEGPRSRKRLEKLLASGRAPVVSAERDILMRPGPSLLEDAHELAQLLQAAATKGAP
jgi:iron complex transport system substrate-binding protein